MRDHELPDDGRPDDCATTTSFSDHGIDDGTDLVTDTHYRLRDAGVAFAPTEAFFDGLESAFLWAYLAAVDDPDVPANVQHAIEDARIFTRREFADRPDADLRTEVLPAFYSRVAGFHCRYHK